MSVEVRGQLFKQLALSFQHVGSGHETQAWQQTFHPPNHLGSPQAPPPPCVCGGGACACHGMLVEVSGLGSGLLSLEWGRISGVAALHTHSWSVSIRPILSLLPHLPAGIPRWRCMLPEWLFVWVWRMKLGWLVQPVLLLTQILSHSLYCTISVITMQKT